MAPRKFLVLPALLFACGGPPPAQPPMDGTPGPAPVATGESGATPAPAAPTKWAEMSHDEKAEHMNQVVVPAFRELLGSYDADRFAKVNCGTCHGPNARDKGFEMPNPDLPPLTMPSGEGEPFAEEKEKHPEITQFMMTQVTPKMVELLPGVKGYDPATGEGFGCFGCHVPKK